AQSDEVAADCHDRNCRRCTMDGYGCSGSLGEDHVRLERNELGGECGVPFQDPFTVPALDDDVPALDIAEFPQRHDNGLPGPPPGGVRRAHVRERWLTGWAHHG